MIYISSELPFANFKRNQIYIRRNHAYIPTSPSKQSMIANKPYAEYNNKVQFHQKQWSKTKFQSNSRAHMKILIKLKQNSVSWDSLTYAELEDDNNSENSPDGMLSDISWGLFEEDEHRDQRQSRAHFTGEYHFSRVGYSHLVSPNCSSLNITPPPRQALSHDSENPM